LRVDDLIGVSATFDIDPLVGVVFREVRAGHVVCSNILTMRSYAGNQRLAIATPILTKVIRFAFRM